MYRIVFRVCCFILLPYYPNLQVKEALSVISTKHSVYLRIFSWLQPGFDKFKNVLISWSIQHHLWPKNPRKPYVLLIQVERRGWAPCTKPRIHLCMYLLCLNWFYFLYLLNYRNISLMIKYEDGHCVQVKTSIRQVNLFLKLPKIFF